MDTSSTEGDDSQGTRPHLGGQDLEKNSVKDEAFLVKFEENESTNPRNWSNMYKAWITVQLGFLAYGPLLSLTSDLMY